MQMTGAKILMECLLEQGVDTVFGYPGGTILCEHPLDETLPDAVGAFTKYRSHKYGKIMVTLYRREAEEGRENR